MFNCSKAKLFLQKKRFVDFLSHLIDELKNNFKFAKLFNYINE